MVGIYISIQKSN